MILLFTGIGIVLLLIFGLSKAKSLTEININRSITINAPKEEVFDMVRYLNNFPKWSPFLAQDPTQKYRVEGEDGTPGAKYHWEGNKGKDLGFQRINKIENNSFVGMECDIQKPFKAKPTFDYTFTGNDGNVTVTQDFNLKSSMTDAFFMWIFGVKKQMEETNEQGLQLLKQALEN